MRRVFAAALGASLLAGCLPDNPSAELGEAETAGETTGETGGDARVEAGLLGCPSGESCTIVAVSQTIDDRVELFTAAGAGASYRGALDLDLKPNPNGDISGQNLDEPYGLAWDGDRLHVLLGHYPTREVGSLLSFPAASLAGYDAGATVANADWFAGGVDTNLDVTLTLLDRTEPLSMVVDPSSGDLLIASFANDLMLPDAGWTVSSELLRVEPGATGPTSTNLDCAGAWTVVALDEDADALAFACDGDEAMVIVDNDGSPSCVADILFSDKRVRYLAPDGLGGVVVAENPPIISGSEDARLWWFDGNCDTRGFSTLEGPTSWELRELVAVPSAVGPRWLLARADSDERGVIILAGDPSDGSVTPCGRVEALDDAGAWTASGGVSSLRPHSLALTDDGFGFAVGAAPADYDSAGPGYGTIWWVEWDDAEDVCDRVALTTTQLSGSAPSVDPQFPQTWRRAPDVLEVIEVLP
jgi:hypothetical protein